MPSSALLTDRYELTMLDAALADGTAAAPAVFTCFGRRLPHGRSYGVSAGLGRLLPLIEEFVFDTEQLAWLAEAQVVRPATLEHLRGYRFRGDVDACPEGEVFGPYAPLVTVRGTFGECVLLETLVLSVLNHDCAIAAAASRMREAAGDRRLLDMGSRRTHEQAAVAAARAAVVGGFDSTSNLEAGRLYGIPTIGTAAHASVLSHDSERAAFQAQVAAQGPGTTLLVDTYDVDRGIRTAVEVAGRELGGVRIDSGDLHEQAVRARRLLDELGNDRTRIVLTSDLDEWVIAGLRDAPVDTYGVGTRLVSGSGHPTAGLVYKLTAVGPELRPVQKTSEGKSGGPSDDLSRQVPVVRAGVPVHLPTLSESAALHRQRRAELHPQDRAL